MGWATGPFSLYSMNLTIDQLKKIKVNIGANPSGSCKNNCSYTVTMYDILQSYVNLNSANLYTDNTLSGNGTSSSKLKIAQQGASIGQTLVWNGLTWAPSFSGSVEVLNDLIDVVLGPLSAGQVLQYNGTN